MAISTIGTTSGATVSPGSPSGLGLVVGGFASQGYYQLPTLRPGTYNMMAGSTNFVRASIGSSYITPNSIGGTTTFSLTSNTSGGQVYGGWAYSSPPSTPTTITFANNLFYMGTSSNIYSSPDGITWTSRGFGKSNTDVRGIAYNGTNLWVACSNNGTNSTYWGLATSTDGLTWTQQTAPDAGYGLAFGNGIFVLLGGTSGIWSSTNGTTWTNRGGSASLYDVAHNGLTGSSSLFVAVGLSGQCYTSVDGISWTSRTTVGTGNGLWQVAYGNGLWVITGPSGVINTSPDGITWTQRTVSAISGQQVNAVAYGNGTWVVQGGNQIITSTDGINWTQRALNNYTIAAWGQYGGHGMAFGNNRFVQASSTGIQQSANGLNGGPMSFSLFSDAYSTLN